MGSQETILTLRKVGVEPFTCWLATGMLMESTVRTTRARIIHLRNDHKDLMSRIERGLHAYHASLSRQQPQALPTASSSGGDVARTESTVIETPFAKINGVVPGSPAEGAGLRVGDRIRRFGNVNWINHENLSRIAETVRRSEGVRILVHFDMVY